MFKLFIKKRDILYKAYREKDLHLGARLELWLLSEDSRGDKYIACDMADESLCDKLYKDLVKNNYEADESSSYVSVNLVGDEYRASNYEEKDAVQIYSAKEFKSYLNKAEVYCKKLNDLCEDRSLFKALTSMLKRKIQVFDDEVDIYGNTLEIRFLGGWDAWSGDEDICDAHILADSVKVKMEKVIKEFIKIYKVKVFWCTGEKAYTYFQIYPMGK